MNYYLTLDYELFLGKNPGSVNNCLILPTEALMKELDKFGVKATFFVDAAYLLRLKQLQDISDILSDDYCRIREQINRLSQSGHSIQMHFHPQWLYSDYKDEKWQMDFSHYKLEDMEYNAVDSLFPDSFFLLQSLTKNKITSFRAGGYSLMDFARYKDLFKRLGISKDSSVLRHLSCNSIFQNYDFTKAPLKTHYSFSSSVVEEDKEGGMMEYPITTAPISGIKTAIKLLLRKRNPQAVLKKWGDGESIGKASNGDINRFVEHVKTLFISQTLPASIDSGALFLDDVAKLSLKDNEGDDVVLIGHPKNLNLLSLKNLGAFINKSGANNFKVF